MMFHLGKRSAIAAATLALTTLLPSLAFAAPKTTTAGGTAHTTTASTRTTAATTAKPVATTTSDIDRLHLTAKQKQQIQQLVMQRRQAIAAVLTAPQKAKFMAGMKQHQRLGTTLQSLNLDAAQKKKIVGIVQQYNQKIKAQLTATQLKQLSQIQQQKQGAIE